LKKFEDEATSPTEHEIVTVLQNSESSQSMVS
jgi:hypothetical protein